MSDPEEPMETEESTNPTEPEQPTAPEAPPEPAPPADAGTPVEAMDLVEGGIALKRVAEALVFASPKPITTKEIVAALKAAAGASEDPHVQALGKAKAAHVIAALGEVQAEMAATGRAFQLVEKVSGWVLVSDPACAAWVRQLYPEAKPTRLTGPQLETLAIIAYRQPSTRADIEAVRGVSVDGVMQVLLDRSLVKIAGRAEVPGRPLLYSTTEYFLEHFGLKNTDELPNSTELKRVVLPTAPVPPQSDPDPAAGEPVSGESAPESAAGEPGVGENAPESESGEPAARESDPAGESGDPSGESSEPSGEEREPESEDREHSSEESAYLSETSQPDQKNSDEEGK